MNGVLHAGRATCLIWTEKEGRFYRPESGEPVMREEGIGYQGYISTAVRAKTVASLEGFFMFYYVVDVLSRYWGVFHIFKLNDVAIARRSFPIYISQNIDMCVDNRSPWWSSSISRMLPVLVRKFEPRLW